MGQSVNTVVIEPRSLVREALISLMARHSYQVVGGFASSVEVENSSCIATVPKLVILGALPAVEAASTAYSIRKQWPETKIVLLFDSVSSADFQKLLASEIDGCIPLLASPGTLVGTLKQILAGDLRVLVLNTEAESTTCPIALPKEGDEPVASPNNQHRSKEAGNGGIDRTNSLRIVHGLSQREEEILKSVVRGHSNKMIARTCGVTDATIKVHMKSILRKIRVENRTQAAIWALEQGYGVEPGRHPAVLTSLQGMNAV